IAPMPTAEPQRMHPMVLHNMGPKPSSMALLTVSGKRVPEAPTCYSRLNNLENGELQ
ncbi:unnamed protein product, partial [Dovyalis caffra]